MNSDDKDEHPSEDAFYQADYDEDTIDYDLDSDKFLEEEVFEPELATNWGDLELEPTAVKTAEQGLEQEQEFDPDLDYELEADEADEPWDDDERGAENDNENYSEPLPLALFAAAAIALLLLGAGGYGVLQQRTAMQEEIRQLQTTLSTTSSNTEVADSRQAQRSLETRNQDLVIQLEYLRAENQRLRDNLPDDKPKAAEPPKTNPTPTPKAKPVKSSVAKPVASASGWFVNFGSYTQRAMAQSWASKLSTEKGKVVVVPGEKGTTSYFRVRIIDLPSQAIAEKIAHQLEQAHNLPPLWIGKQ
jgi:cell division septation protein DedD